MSTSWRDPRSISRGLVALVAIVLLSLIGPIVAAGGAAAQDPAAVRAAKEIQAARDRADAAAQAMFDAESKLDTLDLEIVEAEKQLAGVEAQAASMRSSLQADAQRSFANSGSAIPLLVDLDQANAGITAERQASVARGAASVELDDFDTAMKQVNEQRADLERQKEVTAQARENFESLKTNAEAEVVNLAKIEKQRLNDVAVQRELERQRKIRADQDAAAAASAASQAAQRSSSAQATSSNSSSGAVVAPAATPQGATAPAATPQGAAAPAPAPESPPPSNAGSGMACPIAGPRAFGDTWGAARSGGRSHEGVDMMSPAGTPLVAVESGSVQFKTTSLGGNSVWLNGGSGTRYFYAHLSAWEGSSRSVSQGEVIGYVGATGNTSTNHLHFEVHPGGGRAVNPYPYVRAAC
ncbi:MAG TPA: peptidoglycan DD-metalloendopeptidase family protein [Ilumatobacteraceae bacterium]|nr:peptidoglycan DD-metalloendopeptidase family protein [Ilumatobacteraceae bacterium]